MFMSHCSGLNRQECCNLCNSDQTENCPSNPEANLEERLQQGLSFIAFSYTTCTPNAPFVVRAVKLYPQTGAERIVSLLCSTVSPQCEELMMNSSENCNGAAKNAEPSLAPLWPERIMRMRVASNSAV